MMGTGSPPDKLYAADRIYLDFVGRDTCTGTWRRTDNRCSGMKTLPLGTV
jgi:hypothetical protein